jgi:hypothetical protein
MITPHHSSCNPHTTNVGSGEVSRLSTGQHFKLADVERCVRDAGVRFEVLNKGQDVQRSYRK